jgi:hypothetical protein
MLITVPGAKYRDSYGRHLLNCRDDDGPHATLADTRAGNGSRVEALQDAITSRHARFVPSSHRRAAVLTATGTRGCGMDPLSCRVFAAAMCSSTARVATFDKSIIPEREMKQMGQEQRQEYDGQPQARNDRVQAVHDRDEGPLSVTCGHCTDSH